jgi:hypothetical protein
MEIVDIARKLVFKRKRQHLPQAGCTGRGQGSQATHDLVCWQKQSHRRAGATGCRRRQREGLRWCQQLAIGVQPGDSDPIKVIAGAQEQMLSHYWTPKLRNSVRVLPLSCRCSTEFILSVVSPIVT